MNQPFPQRHLFRSRQRGATVFVVVMAIMLVTSLGLWAMRSASFASAASGYQRQGAQALYVSELGLLTGTAYFSAGYLAGNYAQADADFRAGTSDSCLADPTGVGFCKAIAMSDLNSTIVDITTAIGTPRDIMDVTNAEGSLSPYGSADPAAMEGTFILEMTDPRRVLVRGNDVSNDLYRAVTLTSYGIVRPTPAGGALCPGAVGENAVAAVVATRAQAVVGPINQ